VRTIKSIAGVLLVLIGLVWIGQGLGMIGGSVMSGHGQYAILGLVVAVLGLWLLWSATRSASQTSR
jgi:hypothetical protein